MCVQLASNARSAAAGGPNDASVNSCSSLTAYLNKMGWPLCPGPAPPGAAASDTTYNRTNSRLGPSARTSCHLRTSRTSGVVGTTASQKLLQLGSEHGSSPMVPVVVALELLLSGRPCTALSSMARTSFARESTFSSTPLSIFAAHSWVFAAREVASSCHERKSRTSAETRGATTAWMKPSCPAGTRAVLRSLRGCTGSPMVRSWSPWRYNSSCARSDQE
mmetsp:Transcript_98866/g.262540  ORF Transcript_98866/g.262540 Transcript_98866/m.262540 type:complete len:220 (-) Transcript_98866:1018-1677(-)